MDLNEGILNMQDINELKAKRFKFLYKLYELTGGDQTKIELTFGIGKDLGYSQDEIETIAQFLEGEYLIAYIGRKESICITHDGVKEIEESLTKPDQETQYFPPVNIIRIHHMEGSQIQQGNVNNNQTGSFISNTNDIAEFIELLKREIPGLQLNNEDKSEINAEIATVEAQLSSSRPKKGILRECLGSIQKILEGATGGIIAAKLLKYIPLLLAAL